MKRIGLVMFFCLFIFGCKKNPFDYRTKFLGEYNFVVYETSWILHNPHHDTTYSCTGEVRSTSENLIQIDVNNTFKVTTSVYEDGSLFDCKCINHESVNGEFESTKKLKFDYHYNGLGGGMNYYVIGEKK